VKERDKSAAQAGRRHLWRGVVECQGDAPRAVMAGRSPGHPRLSSVADAKTWMPGTRPGMTDVAIVANSSAACSSAPSPLSLAPTSLPEIIMRALLDVIMLVLQLYVWLLIAAAVLSWLIAFNVVNTRNPVVSAVSDFLFRITEPVLRPIRNALPSLGGIDISPVIVILIIFFIQSVITRYIYPNVF
jgi:YggT family protein